MTGDITRNMQTPQELADMLDTLGLQPGCPDDIDATTMTEQDYVAQRYADGTRRETVENFYGWLAHWHDNPPATVPRDTLIPDLEWAAGRAGLYQDGLLLIRLYRWEWRERTG